MFRLNFYYTKAFVALPAIGSRDMLSAGEREISQEGGGGGVGGGGGEGGSVGMVEDHVEELKS